MSPEPAEHVVLVGLMGSGKSSVGRQLAARLRRPFVDNDEQVQATTGRTVAEISLAEGVDEMRRLEAEAFAEALARPEPAVITAAAGTILDEQIRRRLREPFVVWLQADPATLARRVVTDPLRPLLGDQPEAVLHLQDQQRSALYADVADLVVQVDGLSPAEVTAKIAAALVLRALTDE